MTDDPRRRQDPIPAGLEKQGGDHDVSTDVSPPAETPGQPGYSGGKFDDAARSDRAAERPGGMGGEG
jgi:hypothetical protein